MLGRTALSIYVIKSELEPGPPFTTTTVLPLSGCPCNRADVLMIENAFNISLGYVA